MLICALFLTMIMMKLNILINIAPVFALSLLAIKLFSTTVAIHNPHMNLSTSYLKPSSVPSTYSSLNPVHCSTFLNNNPFLIILNTFIQTALYFFSCSSLTLALPSILFPDEMDVLLCIYLK